MLRYLSEALSQPRTDDWPSDAGLIRMAEARGDVRDDEISFRCCQFQPRRGDFRPESKEWSDSAGRFAERDEDLNLWFADITGQSLPVPRARGVCALR